MSEPLSLSDAFAQSVGMVLSTPTVLRVNNNVTYSYYDFVQRAVFLSVQGGYQITPFAQLDREVLEHARNKLIDLGGNPPPLPDTGPQAAAPTLRKFNP